MYFQTTITLMKFLPWLQFLILFVTQIQPENKKKYIQKHKSIFGFVTVQCYMSYLTQEQLQVRLSENRISALLLRNKLATVCKCESYIISFPHIPFYCTASFISNSCCQMLLEDLQYNCTSFQSKHGRSIPNCTFFPKESCRLADDQHCAESSSCLFKC